MMRKELNQRDIRALKIGAVGGICILLFVLGSRGAAGWQDVRQSLERTWLELNSIVSSDSHKRNEAVPKFKMPETEEKQKLLFRDRLKEQFDKAGVNCQPLRVSRAVKGKAAGYKLMRVKCVGKGNIAQVMDLLTNLKDNEYLAGIEEIKISCNEKNRQEVEVQLTVSTFVRAGG